MVRGGDAGTGRARRARYGVLGAAGRDNLVGGYSQEFAEGRGLDELPEEPGGTVIAAAVDDGFAEFLELLIKEYPAQRSVYRAAVFETGTMAYPLP